MVPLYVFSGKKSKGGHRDMQLPENDHHPTIVWFRDNRASCAECDERREIARLDRLHRGGILHGRSVQLALLSHG